MVRKGFDYRLYTLGNSSLYTKAISEPGDRRCVLGRSLRL